MKFNKKIIIGALAGLGLLGGAIYGACKKDKAEDETTDSIENDDVEVDYVEDVEVEA